MIIFFKYEFGYINSRERPLEIFNRYIIEAVYNNYNILLFLSLLCIHQNLY